MIVHRMLCQDISCWCLLCSSFSTEIVQAYLILVVGTVM